MAVASILARLLLPAACLLARLQCVAGGNLNLLQWNPHWECFAWDQKDCKAQVEITLGQYLQQHQVDFANVVELEDEAYSPPAPWSMIDSTSNCTTDVTSLMYDGSKWKAAAGGGSSRTGCMDSEGSSRPYVVQVFESAAGVAEAAVPSPVIVVGAHFPHPNTFGHLSPEQAAPLKSALAEVVAASGVQQVVLLADTNEINLTASSAIADYLAFPEGDVMSTSLEATCCADSGFTAWGTFDRVITNFGAEVKTNVLMDDIPDWARQRQGLSVGAFHKPILGTLTTSSAEPQERLVVV